MSRVTTPITRAEKEERLRLKQIDGAAAKAEYDAAIAREDEKTARLRAQRLERDRLAETAKPKKAPARPRKPAAST